MGHAHILTAKEEERCDTVAAGMYQHHFLKKIWHLGDDSQRLCLLFAAYQNRWPANICLSLRCVVRSVPPRLTSVFVCCVCSGSLAWCTELVLESWGEDCAVAKRPPRM